MDFESIFISNQIEDFKIEIKKTNLFKICEFLSNKKEKEEEKLNDELNEPIFLKFKNYLHFISSYQSSK